MRKTRTCGGCLRAAGSAAAYWVSRLWSAPAAVWPAACPAVPYRPGHQGNHCPPLCAPCNQVVILTAFLLTVDQVANAGGFEALLVDTGAVLGRCWVLGLLRACRRSDARCLLVCSCCYWHIEQAEQCITTAPLYS